MPRRRIARLKGVAGGRLNVAVISAGDYFFPRLLAHFMRRHPGVTLNLTVHNREELLHRLAENMTDLAVMVRPPQGDRHGAPGVRAARLRDRRVARATRSRAAAGSRSSASCASAFIVARARLRHLDARCDEAFGARFRDVRRDDGDPQQRDDQAGGDRRHGRQLPVRRTRSRSTSSVGNLTVLDVVGFPAHRHWFVVHRRTKRLPPVAEAFKAFLLADGADDGLRTRCAATAGAGASAASIDAAKQR